MWGCALVLEAQAHKKAIACSREEPHSQSWVSKRNDSLNRLSCILVSAGTTVGCRIDTEVYELLDPEWRRQQRGMVDAMQRVRDGFQRPQAERETGPPAR